jgi:hypothetical protein
MSNPEAKPIIVLVGGFLGSGKTTLLLRAASLLGQAGHRVAAITNDQGGALVDTRLAAKAVARADEVTGGCFCCRFSDFIEAIERVRVFGPDVIFSEAVGSCIDIVATVVRPLRRDYADRYRVAPFTVLVEPRRARELLAPGADQHLAWLFANQLEEADLVCFSRADLTSDLPNDLPALPSGFTFFLSGVTGEGVEDWIATLLNADAPAGGRVLRSVDYARYATAEAALGWMNWQARLLLDRPLSPAEVVGPFLDRLDEILSRDNIAIAHLKIIDEAPTGYLRASICRNGEEPMIDGMLTASPALEHELLLNLRARGAPEQLDAALYKAIERLPGTSSVLHFESFQPAPPKPERRIDD